MKGPRINDVELGSRYDRTYTGYRDWRPVIKVYKGGDARILKKWPTSEPSLADMRRILSSESEEVIHNESGCIREAVRDVEEDQRQNPKVYHMFLPCCSL